MKHQVLVTGGTGYIGSHTVVELQMEGYDVVIVDNLSNSRSEVLDGINKITGIRPAFEQFDLTDRPKTMQFFSDHPTLKAIIHFAAFKAVGESVQQPLKYYHNNLASLINLLEGMNSHGVSNFVFSSSCTVYGQPSKLPVTEDAPIQEANCPYGNTKQISEEIIRDTLTAHPLIRAISLRYFNPIGAHRSAFIGELPIGVPNNLVPFITQTAIGIRPHLRVFGADYNTPDGSCIRDYINVTDLAKAHVVAIKRLLGNRNTKSMEIFNLGTGKGSSVFEIIKTFEQTTGLKLNYQVTGRREGDVEQVWADTSLANNVLGWKAEVPLADTLLSAWEWEKYFRSNFLVIE